MMTPNQKTPPCEPQTSDDPYLWLEDIAGERSLTWVREQNTATVRELGASGDFQTLLQRLLAIFDSKERIPYIDKHGSWYYNFWRDSAHRRGLWRRTTLEEYQKADPVWETVLDLDELAKVEDENWVWKGSDVLRPACDRALVFLSRGGADAVVVRELDLNTKEFVRDGFFLPEAKTGATWRNRDALYVGTDFGSGSLTRSGYPRIVKEWRRHSSLEEASVVFEGNPEDVSVSAEVAHDHGRIYEFVLRRQTFFANDIYLRRGNEWIKIDKPDDARLDTFADQLLLRLRSDWSLEGKTYPAGSLLAIDLEAYLKGDRSFAVLFEPTDRKFLASLSATKNYLILNELENVRNKVSVVKHDAGRWTRESLETPGFGSIGIRGIDPDESDDYFLTVTDFLYAVESLFRHDRPGTAAKAQKPSCFFRRR